LKNTKKTSSKSSALHREKKGKGRLILWCVSFALAFIFWLYVAGANNVPVEETYDLIEIVYDETGLAQYGLTVQSVSIDTVNVTIMGSQRDIKAANASDISAKISLNAIKEPGEYSIPVDITTPDGTTVTHQTVKVVNVTVDRPSEKVFRIDTHSVEPTDYTLESGCYLGEHVLSESVISVKGPTRILDTIAKVKVRTASIGSATDGKTVTATVVLFDANGKEINNKNLIISDNASSLTVTLKVYMEKTVKLTASGRYGYLGDSNFKVTPSEITLVGSPDELSKIDAINMFTIDETKLTMTEDLLGQKTEIYQLANGVTTKDGKTAIEGVTVDVLVKDKVRRQEITVVAREIEVDSGSNASLGYGCEAANDITVTVYFTASSNIDSVTSSAIHAYVDASGLSDISKELPVIITVNEAFSGHIYIVDADSYTVNIRPPLIKDDAPSFDGGATPISD